LEVLVETDSVVPLASGALFLVPLFEGEDPLVFDHGWCEISVEVAGLLFLEVLVETDGVVPLASGALFLVPLVEGEDPLVFEVAGLLVAGILVEVESEILFAAGIRFLFAESSAAGVLFLCLCPNRLD